MCEYMIFKGEKSIPYCEPKKKVCTFCIMGNQKTYVEIKTENVYKGDNR